jgi:hypothetical protein
MTLAMPIRDLEILDARLKLDPQTREWLEAFEGPSIALLAEGVRTERPPITAPERELDPGTADWLKSQEFPIRPLLCAWQRTAPATAPGPVIVDTPPRPVRQSARRESFDCALASNMNIESAWVQGSIA